MGGIGSGNFWRHGAKSTTRDYRTIDVRKWNRKKLLIPGNSFSWQWLLDREVISSIQVNVEDNRIVLVYRHRSGDSDWKDLAYPVYFKWTFCNLGGKRPWFCCPARNCGRRVAILYGGGVYACRTCYRLAYPSQREKLYDRAARRADKIRDRLGWEPGILNGEGLKPKGIHWKTFERLCAIHNEFVNLSLREATL